MAYNNFKLINESVLKIFDSHAFEYYHVSSGLKILYLNNTNEEFVFKITIKTPIVNNTGVSHILEHCIASEILNNISSDIYFNGETFIDRTTYTFCCKDEKYFLEGFKILVKEIFYPKVYDDKNIFMREGWRHEIYDKKLNITYNGVVYNEMKGALNFPYNIVTRKIRHSLFNNSNYEHVSGGEPNDIVKLTYGNLKEYHKKFYYPANSYVYIYGNLNLNKILSYLNENIVVNCSKRKSIFFSNNKGNLLKEESVYYPIVNNKVENCIIALNIPISKPTLGEYFIICFIKNIFCKIYNELSRYDKNDSMENIQVIFNNSCFNSYFSILLFSNNENSKNLLKHKTIQVFNNILEDIDLYKKFSDFIKDKNIISNSTDVKYKGNIYGDLIMQVWPYKKDIINYYLEFNYDVRIKDLNELRGFIRKTFITINIISILIVKPKKDLIYEMEEKEKTLLDNYKNKLNKYELNNLIKETKKFNKNIRNNHIISSSSDKRETLKIQETVEFVLNKEKKSEILLYNYVNIKKSIYFWYFDFSTLPLFLTPYVSVLVYLLTYGYQSIIPSQKLDKVKEYDIEVYFQNMIIERYNDSNKIDLKLVIKTSVKNGKEYFLFHLVKSIIYNIENLITNKNILKKALNYIKNDFERNYEKKINSILKSRNNSYFSTKGIYQDVINGIGYYDFIREKLEEFEENWENLKNKLIYIKNIIFFNEKLIVSCYSANNNDKNLNSLYSVIDYFNHDINIEYNAIYKTTNINEGFIIPSNLQYIYKGFNLMDLEYKNIDAAMIFTKILYENYLYPNVRNKSNAYSCNISSYNDGTLNFSTYGDPKLKESLDIFDNASEFLRKLNISKDELKVAKEYQIKNVINQYSFNVFNDSSTLKFIKKIPENFIEKRKENIFSIENSDLLEFSHILKIGMKSNYLCVIGGEKNILENKKLFNNIRYL